MRFNKLILEAFGPFKDRIEIDFSNLNDSGMFLVTGPTGSGKTSIFDAICFSLFGALSNSSNPTERIRSNYADNNTKTYTELTFTFGNKIYNVVREGKDDFKAKLSYDDLKEPITGTTNVNNKIEEILGLDLNMFRQVVMLPQNEFKRLLLSNTSKKQEVFRNIFKTSFIRDFQDNIEAECKKRNNEIDSKINVLNTLISQVDEKYKDLSPKEKVNYTDILEDIDLILDNNIKTLDSKKDEFNKLNNENKDLVSKYQELNELNKNIVIYNDSLNKLDELKRDEYINNYRVVLEKYNNAKRLSDAINNKESVENKIKEFNDNINLLKQEEEKKNILKDEYKDKKIILDNKKEEIDSYREDRLRLTQEMESSSMKYKLKQEMLKLDEELNDFNVDKERLGEEKSNLIIEKDKQLLIYKEYEEKLEDISNLYKEKELINDELRHFKLIKEKLDLKNDLIEKIRKYDTDVSILRKDTLELSSKKASTERALKLNLASSLAKDLVDRKPCPVCGSLEHPNLAIFNDEVTQQDLQDLLASMASVNAKMDQIYLNKKEDVAKRIEIEDFLAEDELVKKYDLDLDNIDEYIGNSNLNIESLNERIEKHTENNKIYLEEKKKYDEIVDRINDIDSTIKEIDDTNSSRYEEFRKAQIKLDIYSNTRDLEVIQGEIEELTYKIKQYEEDVKACSEGEVNTLNSIIEIGKNISEIKNQISAYEAKLEIYSNEVIDLKKLFTSDYEYELCLNTNYEEINSYVKEYDNLYAITKNKIDELEGLVKDKEIANLDEIKEEMDSKETTINALNEEIICLENNIKQINKQVSDIKAHYNEMKDKITKLNKIQKISDIANGKFNSKITFEQYILSIYFEDVIDEANILLKEMSKTRYQLVRKTSLAGRGYQGLEINVFDNKVGQVRGVNSLSGGETFIASLALALGLSNVIRRSRSISSFDTLFIDEGFGSLDPEALDEAYNVLCSLRRSDRVIGLISHVSELKNRVINQIIVEKHDLGSTINILD